MTGPARLIADIGGTNARFARADAVRRIVDEWDTLAAAYPTFAVALDGYLESLGADATFTSAAIAGAGPVFDDRIELTNCPWHIRKDELLARLGRDAAVRIVNDLEAVAHAIPHLADGQAAFIDHEPKPIEKRDRMIVVNIGTGFGSSTLIRAGRHWVSCPSEAGHMHLGASSRSEFELFDRLGGGSMTIEDILSGRGVRHLASVLRLMQSGTLTQTSGATAEFELGDDSHLVREVVRTLAGVLARVCSDLTLASAAWDGVYMCGSVAAAWWRQADLLDFRRQFADNSTMSSELERTPIGLITAQNPALIGLANLDF